MAPGELLLAVADGMDHPLITARAPYDLLIANILAGPLIELAPAFAKSRRARRAAWSSPACSIPRPMRSSPHMRRKG